MAKILILENEFTGKTYREYLSDQLPDHVFTWCKDINTAKKEVDESYSVIVLDQRLDNNELGTSFMKWCKETYPHIVGIMFSALAKRADVDAAFNNKWIIASIEKDGDGLVKLPECIVTAINESEYQRVAVRSDGKPQFIGNIWRWEAPFFPIKAYKVSEYIKDRAYVDEDTWEVKWARHAGQTTSNKTTRETAYTVKVNCDTAVTAGVSVDKIKKLVTKSLKINGEFKLSSNFDYSEKRVDQTEEQYVMPEVDADPNGRGLTMVKCEQNRVFEVRIVGLKLHCPLCKRDKYCTCEIFIPTKGTM